MNVVIWPGYLIEIKNLLQLSSFRLVHPTNFYLSTIAARVFPLS
jgi:hypothetical protein